MRTRCARLDGRHANMIGWHRSATLATRRSGSQPGVCSPRFSCPFHTTVGLETAWPFGQREPDRQEGRRMDLGTGVTVAGRSGVDGMANHQPESSKGRARMAKGESDQTWSFERIYDDYKTPIYNYIYHLVGN